MARKKEPKETPVHIIIVDEDVLKTFQQQEKRLVAVNAPTIGKDDYISLQCGTKAMNGKIVDSICVGQNEHIVLIGRN